MVSFMITCKKGRRALLKSYGGHELTDIFESLDDTSTDDEIEPAIEALSRYHFHTRGYIQKRNHENKDRK